MTTLGRLYAATPTPLQRDFSVDIGLLAQHCARVLKDGADGVILFGTTGEGTFFSAAEKRAALARLIEAGIAADRILVATGANALRDAADMLNTVRDFGCAAGLVLPPYFTKAIDDDGLEEWYAALIAAAPDTPFLLYHIPAVAGVGISPELTRRLMRRFPRHILGIKDSTRDSALAKALLPDALRGLYVSTEADVAGYLAGGGAGIISASLNVSMALAPGATRDGAGPAAQALSAARRLFERFPIVSATKIALAERYGEPAWRRMAPPHRPLAPQDEAQLLAGLLDLEQLP